MRIIDDDDPPGVVSGHYHGPKLNLAKAEALLQRCAVLLTASVPCIEPARGRWLQLLADLRAAGIEAKP